MCFKFLNTDIFACLLRVSYYTFTQKSFTVTLSLTYLFSKTITCHFYSILWFTNFIKSRARSQFCFGFLNQLCRSVDKHGVLNLLSVSLSNSVVVLSLDMLSAISDSQSVLLSKFSTYILEPSTACIR